MLTIEPHAWQRTIVLGILGTLPVEVFHSEAIEGLTA
jgi:BarA-like signal transduction histidine kinase